MTLRLEVRCDGHRQGRLCNALRSTTLPHSDAISVRDQTDLLPGLVPTLTGSGWREQPDGGLLCSHHAHDEDRRTVHLDTGVDDQQWAEP
jgi:hypothetical protein